MYVFFFLSQNDVLKVRIDVDEVVVRKMLETLLEDGTHPDCLTGVINECRRPLFGCAFISATVPDYLEVLQELAQSYLNYARAIMLGLRSWHGKSAGFMQAFLADVEREANITAPHAMRFRTLALHSQDEDTSRVSLDKLPRELFEALERMALKNVSSVSISLRFS